MFDKFKIFYELVGKEKSQGQILCYFVFYTDYIEGVGTRKVIFSQKEVQYNELIIGHNYTFIEKKQIWKNKFGVYKENSYFCKRVYLKKLAKWRTNIRFLL